MSHISKIARELGLKKIDAKEALAVTVTRTDIKRARMGEPGACAYARACKREHPKIKAAYFFRTAAWLQYSDKLVRYVIPPSMQKEIVVFDRSRMMAPGTYYLTKPAPALTMKGLKKRNAAAIDERGPRDRAAEKKRGRPYHVATKNIRGASYAY